MVKRKKSKLSSSMNDCSLDNVNVSIPETYIVKEVAVDTTMDVLEKEVPASAGVDDVVSKKKRRRPRRSSSKCGVNSVAQDNVSVSISDSDIVKDVAVDTTMDVLEKEVPASAEAGVDVVVSKKTKRKSKRSSSECGVNSVAQDNVSVSIPESEVLEKVSSNLTDSVVENDVLGGVNNVVSKKKKRKPKCSTMGVLEKEVSAGENVVESELSALEMTCLDNVSVCIPNTDVVNEVPVESNLTSSEEKFHISPVDITIGGVSEKEGSALGGVNDVVSKKSKRKRKKEALAGMNSTMGVLEKEASASGGVNSTMGVLDKEVSAGVISTAGVLEKKISAGVISTIGVGVLEKEVLVSDGVNNVVSKKSKRKRKKEALEGVNSTMGVLETEVLTLGGVNSTIGVLEKEVLTGINNTIGVLQKDVSAGVSDVVSKKKKRKLDSLDDVSVGILKTDDVEEVPVQLKLTSSPEKLHISPVDTTTGVLEKEVSGGVNDVVSKKKKRKPKRSTMDMTCLDNVSVGIPKTDVVEEVPLQLNLKSSRETFNISPLDATMGVLEEEVTGGVNDVVSKKKKRKSKLREMNDCSSIERTCLDDVSVGIPKTDVLEEVPAQLDLISSSEKLHIPPVDTTLGVLEKEVSGGVNAVESKKKKRKPKRSSIEMTCLDNVSVGILKTDGIEEVPVESNLTNSPEKFHISPVDTTNGVLEKEVSGGVDVVVSKKKKRKPKHSSDSTMEMTCLDNVSVGIPKTDAPEEVQVQLNLTSSCEKLHISPSDTTMGVLDKEVSASDGVNDVVSKKRKRKPKRLDNVTVGTPKADVLEEVPVESNLTCSPEKLHISPADTTMDVLEKEASGGVNVLASNKRKRKSKLKEINDCSSMERTCLDTVSVEPVSGVTDNISLSDINNDVVATDHPVATCSVNVDSNGKPEEAKDVYVIPPEKSERKHFSWFSSEVINPSLQLSQPLDTTTILKPRRKLLVLDVNGLLADVVLQCPKRFKPDFNLAKKKVFKRPFCDDFLQFCFEKFDVGIWSSRTKQNLTKAVDLLLKNMKGKLLFCWDRSRCTNTGFKTLEDKYKPLVLKELKKLWENKAIRLPSQRGFYDESNTILLDDSPYKALRNPPYTAIHPKAYSFLDGKDKSLGPDGDIRLYLERLAEADNVQNFIQANPFGQKSITKGHPSWNFYSKIVRTSKPARNRYY